MNRQKISMLAVFLALLAVTSSLLLRARSNQRLGEPGVRTQPLPGTQNLKVVLPEAVPGYSGVISDQPETVLNALPLDTSFGHCVYTDTNHFQTVANVVLMGLDRTSIHKPQVCLTAQGWVIADASSKVEILPMTRPFPYQLPVMHLEASLHTEVHGKPTVLSGVYVYWFVDGNKLTAHHWQRMWWMARDVLMTGVLDRFAYVSFFAICEPGQETATYERMKNVIMATVPEFQLVPRTNGTLTAEVR